MNLILIRHAEAEISYPDSKRNLTPNGINRFRENSKILKEKIDSLDMILTSPLTRAVQTGDILSEEFEIKESFFIEKILSPGCRNENLIDLADIYNVNSLACVFHLPDISSNFFGFCPTNSTNVDFHPGSIAVISFEEKVLQGKGSLKFYIP